MGVLSKDFSDSEFLGEEGSLSGEGDIMGLLRNLDNNNNNNTKQTLAI